MNITPALLQRKFQRSVKRSIRLLPPGWPSRSRRRTGPSPGAPSAEGLLPYAETVTGSRHLCSAARKATVLGLLSSAAGALLAYYLCMRQSFSLMGPVTMLVFLLLWLLAALLLTARVGKG